MFDSKKKAIDYSNKISKDITKIFKPFGEALDIDNFSYTKITSSNKYFVASINSVGWIEAFYENDGFFDSGHASRQLPDDKLIHYIWPENPTNKIEKNTQERGCWGGCTFGIKQKDVVHHYHFGRNVNSVQDPLNYLSNFKIFEEFISYFNQQTNMKFNSFDEKYYAVHPKNIIPSAQTQQDELINKFLSKINNKSININGRKITFSKREFDCLEELSKGLSFKKIGRILDLSPRTVESYITRMRDKVGHVTRNELVTLYKENFKF